MIQATAPTVSSPPRPRLTSGSRTSSPPILHSSFRHALGWKLGCTAQLQGARTDSTGCGRKLIKSATALPRTLPTTRSGFTSKLFPPIYHLHRVFSVCSGRVLGRRSQKPTSCQGRDVCMTCVFTFTCPRCRKHRDSHSQTEASRGESLPRPASIKQPGGLPSPGTILSPATRCGQPTLSAVGAVARTGTRRYS